MKRSEIIEEARTWIGTKWQHQAAIKKVACDCVGLIRGVGQKWGLEVESEDLRYSRRPYHDEEKLYEICKKYLTEIAIEDAQPGDVFLFGAKDLPAYHIGIKSYDNFVIHTWMDIGQVIESRMDQLWKDELRFAFSFPGVEN
jgi:NlpC/P60 family putative phage cell wall peptidase